MTLVLINPGAGRVRGAQERWAWANMKALLREAAPNATVSRESEGKNDGDGGRWMFRVTLGKRSVLVHSPGCPRSHMKAPLSAGVVFPVRFYVDGNSWMWPYAVAMVRDALGIVRGETK